MTETKLKGAGYAEGSALDTTRDEFHASGLADVGTLRRFVDRYAEANPTNLHTARISEVGELVADIRAELGLGKGSPVTLDHVIDKELTALLLGHKPATRDTTRRAVARGAESVQFASGQFVYDAEDIRIDGAGMDFVFRRTYKNQGFAKGPLGANWDHSYNQWLRLLDGGMSVSHGTGAFQSAEYIRHGHYGAAQLSYWAPPPGEHDAIFDLHARAAEIGLNDTHGADYGLRAPDGRVSFFERDPSGIDVGLFRLKRIEDRFGNYLEFAYAAQEGLPGGRLAKVLVNSPQRFVTFTHDAEGRITVAEDHLQRCWRYDYDSLGDLVCVSLPATADHPAGLQEHYGYSTARVTGALCHNLEQVRDDGGRLRIENEYGCGQGDLAYNRIIRQTHGGGLWQFDYERVAPLSPMTASPEEEIPAHQTVVVQRNGHPVHFIYNRFGNLLAREEVIWEAGVQRRLVSHLRYNRDGATVAEVSAEGRVVQRLLGREAFLAAHNLGELSEEQLLQHQALTWTARQSFGNRIAEIRRATVQPSAAYQTSVPLPGLGQGAISVEDIITKYTYEPVFQQLTSVSHPEYTRSPWPGSAADAPSSNPDFARTLTRFVYRGGGRELAEIIYPNTTRGGQADVVGIREEFLSYDNQGRLLDHRDRAGTLSRRAYYPITAGAGAAKTGYLHEETVDPADPLANPNGLDLVTRYEVNAAGSVTAVTTPKGHRATFELNALQQVTKAVRSLAPGVDYETRYAYGDTLQVSRMERDLADANGAALPGGVVVTLFTYDSGGNLISESVEAATGSDRLVTRHRYDNGDRLVSTVLPRGNEARLTYDARRLPRSSTRGFGTPEASTERYGHDGDALLSEYRDGRNQRTRYLRDAFGRVTEVRDYDEQGTLFRVIRQDHDKLGNVTAYRVFAPAGAVFETLRQVSNRYDELGQLIEVSERRFEGSIPASVAEVKARGVGVLVGEALRTVLRYDRAGRVVSEERIGYRVAPGGGRAPQPTVLTTRRSYNAAGWPVSETDPFGNVTETHYDKHGQVRRVDVREAVSQTVSPSREEVFTTYFETDALDRVVAITDALGNTQRFAYDSLDRVTRRSDLLGNVTRWEYDVHGRQIAQRDERTATGLGGGPPLATAVNRWTYDDNGNAVLHSDPLGRSIRQDFDALDRRTGVTYADGTGITWSFDGNGNQVTTRDARGVSLSTRYDALDNPVVTEIDLSAVPAAVRVDAPQSEAFEYDALGRLRRARNDWCDIHIDLDSLGNAYREDVAFAGRPTSFTLARAYDDFGFAARVTYPAGRTIARTPDSLQRVAAIDNVANGQSYPGNATLGPVRALLARSHRGLRAGTAVLGNGTRITQAEDRAGRPYQIDHVGAGGQDLLRLLYLYDAAGNPRLVSESAPLRTLVETHCYDSQSHLTHTDTRPSVPNLPTRALTPWQVAPPDWPPPSGQADIDAAIGALPMPAGPGGFAYDLAGNRISEAQGGATITSVVNANNQCMLHGARQIRYDPAGHVSSTSDQGQTVTFAHDHRGRLTSADGAVPIQRIRYDPLGRRIWSSSGAAETYLIYDGADVIEEWRSTAPPGAVTIRAQYVHDDETEACCHAAVDNHDYWLHTDLIGSTRLLTDEAGAAVARYAFTPFGTFRGAGPIPAIVVPFGFAGRRFDATLGLYDFTARHYDPHLGRFLERDPAALDVDGTDSALPPVLGPLGTSTASIDAMGRPRNSPPMAASDYSYARNNPLRYADARGTNETELIKSLARNRAFRVFIQTFVSWLADGLEGPGPAEHPPPAVRRQVPDEDEPIPERETTRASRGKGRPPRPRPRPPAKIVRTSQTPKRPPQTRARGGPTRGTPGFATPGALRGIGMGFIYGHVAQNYIRFFRAGLGIDLEQRQQWSDVFRMSKEQLRELQRQRRQQDLKQAQKDYERHLQATAKERGVSVDELKETYKQERERTRHLIRAYPTISAR